MIIHRGDLLLFGLPGHHLQHHIALLSPLRLRLFISLGMTLTVAERARGSDQRFEIQLPLYSGLEASSTRSLIAPSNLLRNDVLSSCRRQWIRPAFCWTAGLVAKTQRDFCPLCKPRTYSASNHHNGPNPCSCSVRPSVFA